MKTVITTILSIIVILLLLPVFAFATAMLGVTKQGDSTYLPKINFFAVKPTSDKNIISWKTDSDSASVYYEVERSEDSVHFKTIALVLGPSPKVINENYFEFRDYRNLKKHKQYYRIKQINAAGEFYYTGIIRSIRQH